jgi:hypothetical protein
MKRKKEIVVVEEESKPALNEEEMFNEFQTGVFALYDKIYKGTPMYNNGNPLYAVSVNTFGSVYRAVVAADRKKLLNSFTADVKNAYAH